MRRRVMAAWAAGAVAVGGGAVAPPATAKPAPRAVTVYLRQPRLAAAEAFVRRVTDPRSPDYRRFLTPRRFVARFSPSSEDARLVVRYLQAHGFADVSATANRLFVRGSATVAALARTFPRLAHAGAARTREVRAILPAALRKVASGATVARVEARPVVRRGPTEPPTACSPFWGARWTVLPQAYGRTAFPTAGCGYTPTEIARAYDLTPLRSHGLDGSGLRVAVVLAYGIPDAEAAIDRFSSAHGVPPLIAGQLDEVIPPAFTAQAQCGSPLAFEQEATGDLELVHELAPGAGLEYVAAASCLPSDIVAVLDEVADHHLADVVTGSFGYPISLFGPEAVAAAHVALTQAAAEGISVLWASGDAGDNSPLPYGVQANYPSSDPMVTSVGGSSLLLGPRGLRLGELGWGTTLDPVDPSSGTYRLPLPGQFAGGSAGGRSVAFAQPGYQAGVVPPQLAGTELPARVYPDIAQDADPATGALVGLPAGGGAYVEAPGGGTSASSPIAAGIVAVAAEAAGGPVGPLNPILYETRPTVDVGVWPTHVAVAAAPGASPSLGSEPTLDTLQHDTSLAATPGYDDQTGLGSLDGARLAAVLEARGGP